MDSEKLEYKAKANEKTELTLVSEYFEAVFVMPHSEILWRVQRRNLVSRYS